MANDVKALPVVAYRWVPSPYWGDYVHSGNPDQADEAEKFGITVEPLVLKSDAESALAELRAEVERLTACIEQMTSDLARCRDAFGIPAGDGHLSDAWTSAMAMPEEVPHYVEAAAAHLGRVRRAAQRALDAWDSTVLPKAHDGMMQERMEELRGECIEQARIDKQRADTSEARLAKEREARGEWQAAAADMESRARAAEARLERARGLLEEIYYEAGHHMIKETLGRIRAFLGEGNG